MWEFREAIKAEILDVRADAEEEVAEQAEDEADMLETRTATLKVATEQFRELKNTTRDFLRTSVTVLDKQTAETKEATKEVRFSPHTLHACCLLTPSFADGLYNGHAHERAQQADQDDGVRHGLRGYSR